MSPLRRHLRSTRNLPLLCLLLLLPGCGGGGDSSTSPTPPIPNVAGNYSGTTTLTFPELGQQISCPTTTSVTQSGATVTFAPIVMAGACDVSVPVDQVTIDSTGLIQGQTSETVDDPSCGQYTVVGTGRFVGRELQLQMTATSNTCPDFNLTMTLTR